MSSTTQDVQVRSYIAALEAELDDLPESDRHELLEDLEQHLGEVAAEDGAPLEDRLGSPADYAAELRTSAGLPARREPTEVSRIHAIRAGFTSLRDQRSVRAVLDFLPELRTSWWIVRGYLVALIVDALFLTPNPGALPRIDDRSDLGWVFVAMWIVISVLVGKWTATRGPQWPFVVANVVIVLAVGPALAEIDYARAKTEWDYYIHDAYSPGLHHDDGTAISNICAYNSKMEPIKKVLLFDQSGRPIDDLAKSSPDEPSVPRSDLDVIIPPNQFPRVSLGIDGNTGEIIKFVEQCPTFDDAEPRR